MSLITKSIGRLSVVATLIFCTAVPGMAHAEEPSASETGGTSAVTEVPMAFDCSQFTEADRQKAIKLNVNYCGALNGAPGTIVSDNPIRVMASHTSNCGTSAIYVDRVNGRVRISYGLHSTAGPILEKTLNVSWGPTVSGTYEDLSPWGSEDYSSSLIRGAIAKGKKEGATLRGSVVVAGWIAYCVVSAEDPIHGL